MEGLRGKASGRDERPSWVPRGTRCPRCGRLFYPPRWVCVPCGREGEMEEMPLSRRGRIHSFTVIHVGQEGFEVPYAVGYIDLPEGVRLFGPLKGEGVREEDLAIGMEVEMSPSGRGGFYFRPVKPVKG